ncbi:MAG: HAMP domain-containing sensor histidine kinase [Anaerolineae bacterium]
MEPTAFGPHRKWYKQLIVQPGIWAILLLPVLLISAVGQEIALYHYAAKQYLAEAQFQASLLAACSQNSPSPLNENAIIQCLRASQGKLPRSIWVVDNNLQVMAQLHSATDTSGVLPLANAADLGSGADRYYLERPSGSAATLLVALAQVPGQDLYLLTKVSFSNVLNRMNDVIHIGIITGPLSLLLVGIVLFLTLRTIVYPLRKIAGQASRIGQGDLSGLQPSHETGVDEIVQLNHSLVTMGQKINRYQYSIQNYVTKITEVQEVERHRLSHDLHDETMQGLVAVGQRLQLAQRALERDDRAGSLSRISQARELNQMVMDELRRTIRALRPTNLEGAGLLSALEALTNEFESLGVESKFTVIGESRPIHSEIELAAFRVAQEALSNVKKHSQARHITVSIKFEDSGFTLQAQDDGIGFSPPPNGLALASNGHYGLIGMQERVFAVGGELEIHAARGHGTSITARFPYTTPAAFQTAEAAS